MEGLKTSLTRLLLLSLLLLPFFISNRLTAIWRSFYLCLFLWLLFNLLGWLLLYFFGWLLFFFFDWLLLGRGSFSSFCIFCWLLVRFRLLLLLLFFLRLLDWHYLSMIYDRFFLLLLLLRSNFRKWSLRVGVRAMHLSHRCTGAQRASPLTSLSNLAARSLILLLESCRGCRGTVIDKVGNALG